MLARLLKWLRLQGFWSRRDEFYEELAAAFQANEALRDFLKEEMRISSSSVTANPSRAFALRLMRGRLAAGDSVKLSTILGPALPPSDLMMLAAVDDAKDKPALLRSIAEAVREQRLLRGLVRKKAVPPLLVIPGAFGFAYIMATQSLPVISKIAPPSVWDSGMNGAVRTFATFIADYGVLAGLVVAGVIVAFTQILPRWTGPWRARLESMNPKVTLLLFPVCPFLVPLSIYRDVQVGLLFSAMAVMLRSGRTLTDALSTIRRNSQPWLRWHVRRILQHLEVNPTEYRQAFAKGLMSPALLARLSSQIRTNPNFDAVLVRLGLEGNVEVRKVVERQTGVINGMLLAAGAGVVVFMMLGQLSISQSLTEEMSPAKQMERQMRAIQQSKMGK
jgi:type II secretory pathway component PulF